jgi:hypothetical protein
MMAITIFIDLSPAQAASIPVTALSGGFTCAGAKRAIKPRANSHQSATTVKWSVFRALATAD